MLILFWRLTEKVLFVFSHYSAHLFILTRSLEPSCSFGSGQRVDSVAWIVQLDLSEASEWNQHGVQQKRAERSEPHFSEPPRAAGSPAWWAILSPADENVPSPTLPANVWEAPDCSARDEMALKWPFYEPLLDQTVQMDLWGLWRPHNCPKSNMPSRTSPLASFELQMEGLGWCNDLWCEDRRATMYLFRYM